MPESRQNPVPLLTILGTMKLRTLLLCAVALTPAIAGAQTANDAQDCIKLTRNPDKAIEACTRAINSGKIAARDLAQLHYSRGAEWAAKGDHDRAIADFDVAIHLNAQLAEAFYSRGVSWAHKGEPDRAIPDFDAALRLNPKNADAFQSRGTEWLMKGDYKRALADFDASARLDPQPQELHFPRARALFYSGDHLKATGEFEKAHQFQPSDYTALWLFLARKHAKDANAEAQIERDTRNTRDGTWPSGVIALYAGEADPDAVMKSADHPDPKRQVEYRCEANFYIAHWHWLRGTLDRAGALFEDAQRICPKNVIEYEGTLSALRAWKRK